MLNRLTFNTNKFTAFILGLMIAASFAVGTASAQAKVLTESELETTEAQNHRSYDLTGTWQLTIIPDDGSPSFVGFYSFGGDGNASFSSAGPPIPGLGNPGYGVWKKQSTNRFKSVIKMISYTSDFQFDGTLRIRAQIHMTGPNSFVTTDSVTIYSPDGAEIISFGGNALGRRITTEE